MIGLTNPFIAWYIASWVIDKNAKEYTMNTTPASSRRREWQTFLLLTVILIPLLSVMFVAGYGFIVWFLQMFFGPPSHGI